MESSRKFQVIFLVHLVEFIIEDNWLHILWSRWSNLLNYCVWNWVRFYLVNWRVQMLMIFLYWIKLNLTTNVLVYHNLKYYSRNQRFVIFMFYLIFKALKVDGIWIILNLSIKGNFVRFKLVFWSINVKWCMIHG